MHLAEFFEHNVSNLRAHPADKIEKLLPSEWKKLNAKTDAGPGGDTAEIKDALVWIRICPLPACGQGISASSIGPVLRCWRICFKILDYGCLLLEDSKKKQNPN